MTRGIKKGVLIRDPFKGDGSPLFDIAEAYFNFGGGDWALVEEEEAEEVIADLKADGIDPEFHGVEWVKFPTHAEAAEWGKMVERLPAGEGWIAFRW